MYHKLQLSSIFRAILAFPRIHHYTYRPLDGPTDSIRIILLQPALYLTSPIRCRLVETTWSHEKVRQGYVSLSYTWGNPIPKSTIEIDGRPFEITRNLELALRYLRLPRNELRLWADGICINQENTKERNQHVTQMRSIYSAAKETTIFLGEATEGSDILLNAINEARVDIALARTRNAVVKALVNASGLTKRELIEKAFEILCHQYWVRIWVFQEIVVSNNPWVQCGRVKVPWEYFCQAILGLLDSDLKKLGPRYSNEPKRRLQDIYWERRAYRYSQGLVETLPKWDVASGREFKGRMRLLDLLVTKRGSQASDWRDMVFAVAGIATKPKDWDPVSITYEKSLSLVYMSVAKYLIEHHESYEVLSHAGMFQTNCNAKKGLHKIPSWAPDWRIPSDFKNKVVDWIPPQSSKELVASSHFVLEEEGILVCLGNVFDTVHSVSDNEDSKLHLESIGRASWNKWHRRVLLEHGVLSHPKMRLGSVTNLFARSHPLTYRRRLAKTKGGILCLVPRGTRPGDLICQFTGSTVPFILRPWKDDDHWVPDEPSVLSRSVLKFLEWVSWSPTPDLKPDPLDLEISAALKAMKQDENLALDIQHHTLVGECFVDGLMRKDVPGGTGKIKQAVAFALH